jgi:predicted aspartyl protease
MPTFHRAQTGYLESNGHPCIKIKVHGISGDLAQEFEAMIDTGFNGFLLMPIMAAFPLGLPLYGTAEQRQVASVQGGGRARIREHGRYRARSR